MTTPTYNTAIVAVNQNAFPYGGLDLARLFDGQQEVAANIGGRPPASFGLLVRDVGGHQVTASQLGRARVEPGVRPLRLTKAPRGAGAVSSAAVGRAYAGPFSDLRATGTSRHARIGAARVAPLHAGLDPDELDRDPAQPAARATPPTCCSRAGAAPSGSASVVAVLRDGERVTVGSRLIPLSTVAYLWVRSERSGYVVVPASRPAGAGVHALRVSAQSSDPRPGPTLAIQIARAQRFSRAALSVRLMPVHDEQEATAAAARLR